jgi:hypothetical protein
LGKNAEAVADLTLAFLVNLTRGLPKAQRFLDEGHQLRDNREGARFVGGDLRRHVPGAGRLRADRASRRTRVLAFCLTVLVYDPLVHADDLEQVETLGELLARSDFLSLHAGATPENENMIEAAALAAMSRSEKTDTFVLDFRNELEEIQEAFRPYCERTDAPTATTPGEFACPRMRQDIQPGSITRSSPQSSTRHRPGNQATQQTQIDGGTPRIFNNNPAPRGSSARRGATVSPNQLRQRSSPMASPTRRRRRRVSSWLDEAEHLAQL